ncbi:MAG: hypothetical protein MZW92_23420 [Comamonadaceae bacterium]|nr:hypothetical protein [Comamonadaceae bacterium]
MLELGMNHPGEIALLARLGAADGGAGQQRAARAPGVHGQRRGGGARERQRRSTRCRADGAAVFPADDAYAPLWRELAGTRRVLDLRAATARADVTAERRLAADGAAGRWRCTRRPARPTPHAARGRPRTTCTTRWPPPPARWPPARRWRAVGAGLAAFEPVAGRSQRCALRWRGARVTLVDDSYNANPDSVRAAIDVLADAARRRAGWCWATWARSATQGPAFHAEVGAYARAARHRRAVDAPARCAAAPRAFGAGARTSPTSTALVAALRATRRPAASVLVKGSRFMQMERVVQALQRARSARGRSACCSACRSGCWRCTRRSWASCASSSTSPSARCWRR